MILWKKELPYFFIGFGIIILIESAFGGFHWNMVFSIMWKVMVLFLLRVFLNRGR